MSRWSLPRLGAGLVVALATALAVGGASCGSSPVNCPEGETACGSLCKDLQTDSANCGLCGRSCIAGASCQAGSCQCQTAGETPCGLACANTSTDSNNCGACGHACGLGTCGAVGGAPGCLCSPSTSASDITLCPPGEPATGTCVDLETNAANCGGCGNSCSVGFTCSGAACVCNSPRTVCPAGTGQVCANTSTDRNNCGTCGNACPSAQACTGGACLCPSATPNLCGAVCTNVETDSKNCGVCGTVCPANEICNAGACGLSCPSGEVTCAGKCCAGTACCGSGGQATCQIQHDNGAGQNFFDCSALGTFTQELAMEAALAWAPTGSQGSPTYLGCVSWLSSASAGAQACGVWCYSNASNNNPGSVYVNQGTPCISPINFGSLSTWQ